MGKNVLKMHTSGKNIRMIWRFKNSRKHNKIVLKIHIGIILNLQWGLEGRYVGEGGGGAAHWDDGQLLLLQMAKHAMCELENVTQKF